MPSTDAFNKFATSMTQAESHAIEDWANRIIDEHFSSLPAWVNRDLFYKEFRNDLIHEAFARVYENDDTLQVCWILGVPLRSEYLADIDLRVNYKDEYPIPEWFRGLAKANLEVEEKQVGDTALSTLKQRLANKGANPDWFRYDIESYPKCIVLSGETKLFKDVIKACGGKWNTRLKCGPGWVFSKRSLSD